MPSARDFFALSTYPVPWKLPWPDSPHLHLDRFYPTALLSQTAGLDTNQPPGAVRAFHQQLAPYYVQAPERLRYIEYPNSPHDLRRQDEEEAWNAVVNWFEIFLSSPCRCPPRLRRAPPAVAPAAPAGSPRRAG